MLNVEAGKKSVTDGTSFELEFSLVVEGKTFDVLDGMDSPAGNSTRRGHWPVHLERTHIGIHAGISEVGANSHLVIEPVLELVTGTILGAPECVIIRVPDIQVPTEETGIACRRQKLRIKRVEIAAFRIALIITGNNERGIFIRLPLEGRRNTETLFIDIVITRAGGAANNADAILPCSIRGDGAGGIKTALNPSIGPHFKSCLVRLHARWFPADLIDKAAGAHLAIKKCCRPLQDVDALKKKRIDGGCCKGLTTLKFQAIQIIHIIGRRAKCAEAAQKYGIVTRIRVPVG